MTRRVKLRIATSVVVGVCAAGGCDESTYPEPATTLALPDGYGEQLAGRAFTTGDGVHHTLADLGHVALRWTIDVAARTATAHAEVHFQPVETGVPFFLLTPAARNVTLDGVAIALAAIRTTPPP